MAAGITMKTGRHEAKALGVALFVAAMASTAFAQTPASAPAPAKIDLKLFEKAEIDRSKGCTFVLWQGNRDPEKDRYAYAFAETLGRNHARENARVKIGNDVLTFRRIAVGGAKEYGYKTFPYALYKAEKSESFLILDLKLEDSPGEVLDIDGGTMTVIRPGLPPFVADVKGNAGCNTPAAAPAPQKAAAPPAPASRLPPLEPPGVFERYSLQPNAIPAKIRNDATKRFGCDDKIMRQGGAGYSLSEESALWELSCQSYAGGAVSKVYALVYTLDPAKQYTFQVPDIPKGKTRQGHLAELMAPKWEVKTRIVTASYTEGNGSDCGVYERHQLTADGTLALIEYREKTICDGKSMKPSEFPLVYRR